jgi:putative phosphoesterase
MRVGILSDTHGKTRRVRLALDLLAARGLDLLVHCGDVGSAAVLELLAAPGVPVHVVPGNMDRRGVVTGDMVVEVDLPEGRLAVTHGHLPVVLEQLIESGQYAWVCHGHTHRIRDERIGTTRVINPGAVAHPRDPRHPTVALLDTTTDTLELLVIPR